METAMYVSEPVVMRTPYPFKRLGGHHRVSARSALGAKVAA